MKTNFTFKNFFLRKEGWITVLIAALFFFFGCYEFKVVNQPTDAYNNSSFEVNLILGRDNDAGNDFTLTDGSLADSGLVGILLPVGWTVKDSIYYEIHTADSLQDGLGVWRYAGQDYSSNGYIRYSAAETKMLTDSADVVPEGYYWWGGKTYADLKFLDSIFFTVKIFTNELTGTFYLQYAVGDEDYWGRMPYDPECITEPTAINITQNPNTGVNALAEKVNVSVYPNPTHGLLYIELSNYNNEPVDMIIYDSYGRTVVKHLLQSENNSYDLNKLAPGTYFVRLQSGNDVISKKILLY
jgi:Secretion system C-terminal sorting domain